MEHCVRRKAVSCGCPTQLAFILEDAPPFRPVPPQANLFDLCCMHRGPCFYHWEASLLYVARRSVGADSGTTVGILNYTERETNIFVCEPRPKTAQHGHGKRAFMLCFSCGGRIHSQAGSLCAWILICVWTSLHNVDTNPYLARTTVQSCIVSVIVGWSYMRHPAAFKCKTTWTFHQCHTISPHRPHTGRSALFNVSRCTSSCVPRGIRV